MSRFAYTYEDPTYDIDDHEDWEDLTDEDLSLVKVTMTREELMDEFSPHNTVNS
jgi:hypothetical protein